MNVERFSRWLGKFNWAILKTFCLEFLFEKFFVTPTILSKNLYFNVHSTYAEIFLRKALHLLTVIYIWRFLDTEPINSTNKETLKKAPLYSNILHSLINVYL